MGIFVTAAAVPVPGRDKPLKAAVDVVYNRDRGTAHGPVLQVELQRCLTAEAFVNGNASQLYLLSARGGAGLGLKNR